MPQSTLHIDHLDIGYLHGHKSHLVGHNLTAQLQTSALTLLIGLNGSGKTTLLRTLSGLQRPMQGFVGYGDRPLANFTPRQLARTIAVVLTDRPQTGYLRVREIVEMGRMPHTAFSGRISELDRQIANQSMELTGVQRLARRLFSDLSDGERQRVMIAKALAQQTPCILLDEPTAFLDFAAKQSLMELLANLAHSEHKAILLSTHDLHHALPFADQCWLLTPSGLSICRPEALSSDTALQEWVAGSLSSNS